MSPQLFFYMIFGSVMFFGVGITESAATHLLLAGILAIAVFFQTQIFSQTFMGQDRYFDLDLQGRKKFFLRGLEIDTFLPEDKESDFLSEINGRKYTWAIRLGYLIGFGIFLYFMTSNPRNTPSLSTYLHVFGILLMIPMATPAHFLVPLTLNSGAVVAFYMRQPSPPLIPLAVYSFFLIASLGSHSTFHWHWSALGAGNAKIRAGLLTRFRFSSAILFLSILFTVNWLLPNKLPLNEEPVFKELQKLNKSFSKVSNLPRELAQTLVKGNKPSRGAGMNRSSGEERDSKNPLNKENGQNNRSARDLPMPDSKGPGQNESDGKQSQENAIAEATQTSSSSTQKASGSQSDLKTAETKSLKDEIQKHQEILNTSSDPKQKADSQEALNLLAQKMKDRGTPTRTVAEQHSNADSHDPIGTRGKTESGPAHKVGDPKDQSAPEPSAFGKQKPPSAPLLSEDLLKKIYQIAKFLFALGMVILAAALVLNLKKKPGKPEKKVVALNETKRRLVKDALQELKKTKLSARDEIIKKYQLFLKFMETLQHGRADSTPPTHYYRHLGAVYPKLHPDFKVITDTFCDTLYGHKAVEAHHLSSFNRSLDTIVNSFN
jgi:hypothetical protein